LRTAGRTDHYNGERGADKGIHKLAFSDGDNLRRLSFSGEAVYKELVSSFASIVTTIMVLRQSGEQSSWTALHLGRLRGQNSGDNLKIRDDL